jgi:hypothetical protein
MTATARNITPSNLCESDAAAWHDRLEGTNINQNTLLATDYLNHFNEVVMMMEMIPDMPDCMEDVAEWAPKTYKQHFADSFFSDKDLAIEAYDFAPSVLRDHFETTVGQANRLVELSVERLTKAIEDGDDELLKRVAERASRNLKKLVEVAGAVINGSTDVINQVEVDDMFAPVNLSF